MKTEGLSIIEQVEIVMDDMKQLLEELEGTDSENIDFDQLRKLANYSKNYAIDIRDFVANRDLEE